MKKLFKEFTAAQLARLKKEYEPLRGQRISMNLIDKMNTMLSKYSTDMLVKLANTDIPFIATGAKNMAVTKRGKKWSDFKTKLDMAEADELQQEACWVGYKKVGMKKKGDRMVPNCVKEDLQEEVINEASMKRLMQAIQDKLSDEGGAAGFDDLKKTAKSMGVDLTKDMLKDIPGVKQHRDGDYILEADLSKTQVKMVHKKADDMPKKGFMKRYGKDGDSVRYATATNIVKKKLGIEDMEEAFTKKDFKDNERDNEHGLNATKVVGMFGTAKEKMKIDAINARHNMRGSISRADQTERDAIVNKYYGKLKEQRALTNPDVAVALRQYAAQRPLEFKKSAGNFPYKEGDKKANFDILQDLALKDMKQFNIKFKAMDNDSKDHVKKALAKKGLSSTLVNDNKPKGDQTMNESYKDKFNATMKKFGIDSLDDLKSDEEKKKFFRAVDNAHDAKNEELTPAQKKLPAGLQKAIAAKGDKKEDKKVEEGFASDAQRKAAFASGYKEKDKKKDEMAKMNAKHKPGHNEMAMNAMKMNAMKMPIQSMYGKMNAMKTGDDDLTPMNNMKMNAMIKDPHKSKEEDPKRDMNAGYMKSDVRADVKNGGGIDMSKVKDAPKMQTAMKKINAMYKTEKYHDTKPGSIQDVVNQMYQAEHRLVTVEDKKLDDMIKQYMSKGGTITKLPPALQKGSKPSDMKKHQVGAKGVVKSMKMKEVREFISTYNSHFLTNFKAEEFILKD